MKKIVLIVTISAAIFSCSKVKKGEFLITGTAKGYADGKTVVLEKQDEMMGLVPVDTVKIKDGKFEIKGKITEPAIYTIQLQDAQGKIPVIVENEAIMVTVDKDSIQKSKVSGSYNNDEFTKFNQEMQIAQKKAQKEMTAYQTANMAAMEAAQKSQDTAAVNKLRKEFGKIQEQVTSKYLEYAESHPKSYISALIIEGMFKQPGLDFEKAKKMYNNLDKSLKDTKSGKATKLAIDNYGKPQTPPAPAAGPQPAAAPAK
jgi:Domain of unknown function (DUF4369)